MNVLFITLLKISDINDRGLYHDLIREFMKNGHDIFIMNPIERRETGKTHIIESDNATILRVKTLNIQKINTVEKGLATLTIEHLFLRAFKKYFSKIKFDLVIYTTPPITITKLIQFVKKRDNFLLSIITYLDGFNRIRINFYFSTSYKLIIVK